MGAHTDHLPFEEQEASARGPKGCHLPGSLDFCSFLICEGGEETVLGEVLRPFSPLDSAPRYLIPTEVPSTPVQRPFCTQAAAFQLFQKLAPG